MVLADDDFGTLRAAIEEGRRVYDNLVKALSFVLPTSLGQALIIAIAVLTFPLAERPAAASRGAGADPLDQPDRRRCAALPLALEAAEPDLMRRPRGIRGRRCWTHR